MRCPPSAPTRWRRAVESTRSVNSSVTGAAVIGCGHTIWGRLPESVVSCLAPPTAQAADTEAEPLRHLPDRPACATAEHFSVEQQARAADRGCRISDRAVGAFQEGRGPLDDPLDPGFRAAHAMNRNVVDVFSQLRPPRSSNGATDLCDPGLEPPDSGQGSRNSWLSSARPAAPSPRRGHPCRSLR